VEAGFLSGQTAEQAISEALCKALELRRDQLYLPPFAVGFHAGELGRSHARGLCLRSEGESADHAHPAAQERGGGDGTVSADDRPSAHGPPSGADLISTAAAVKVRHSFVRDYLAILPAGPRYAFEFRHTSWLSEPVYDELRQRNISLCLAESEKLEVPEVITADFVYYRLRKPDYTEADVDAFAARASELLATGKDLYLMFKHEETPEGALNAEMLLARGASRLGGDLQRGDAEGRS
jgi:hypothetical protein